LREGRIVNAEAAEAGTARKTTYERPRPDAAADYDTTARLVMATERFFLSNFSKPAG
jgi:hypothetical protein